MTVRYAIRPAQPAAHLFHVTITLAAPDPLGQQFRMPVWIPGSYMIREFARNVIRASALGPDGRKLRVEKIDKHTWRCAPVEGELTLAYEVYAWDLSVRSAHLDATHGFFNGPAVFMQALGHESSPCRVDILPPPRYAVRAPAWKVLTGLAPARGTRRGEFGTYLAADYDELIDSPIELGTFAHATFSVQGVPHEVGITGQVPKLDLQRLTADITRVCDQHIRLFEPRAHEPPFDRYVFLTLAVGDGYGGLEHRNSTALICKRDDLPHAGMKDSTEAYRNFLGLVSHEYFHAWHVKRIRPAAFVPYDLTQENYTRLLWVFEGFTSYYDDLLLARAGLFTEAQYLDAVGRAMSTVMQRSSRLKQSVADSSFDAWIKYYRQDENAPNAVVSYYQKGALVALALDLTIRAETDGRRSLDDLMRLLWRRWKRAGAGYAGVGEAELVAALEEATGLRLARHLREWADGTRDPDFEKLLAPFGLVFERRPALESPHFALLGLKTAGGNGEARVVHVFDSTPAQQAGISGGDSLVAVGGLRASAANIDRLLARYAPGDTVEVTAFRRDELMRFDVTLARQPPQKYTLRVDPKAPRTARRLRERWLGAR